MTVNTVRWEEGTGIALESGSIDPGDGWTIIYASINRVGSLVAIHIEAAHAAGAQPNVCVLPPPFRPARDIISGNGTWTIASGDDPNTGVVQFEGDMSGEVTAPVCEIVFQAADSV